jgi:hypothetical protein
MRVHTKRPARKKSDQISAALPVKTKAALKWSKNGEGKRRAAASILKKPKLVAGQMAKKQTRKKKAINWGGTATQKFARGVRLVFIAGFDLIELMWILFSLSMSLLNMAGVPALHGAVPGGTFLCLPYAVRRCV